MNVFKDYQKYLKVSLKVYIFVLAIVVILKLIGVDYFDIDINNQTMLRLNEIFMKYRINYIWYFINLYLQFYLYLGLVCNTRKHYIYALIGTILNVATQLIIINLLKAPNYLYSPISIGIMIIIPMFINKEIKILKQLKIVLLMTLFVEDYLDERYKRECHYAKTVGEFAKEHPYGKYAITMAGHITALIDGVIIDTFDPSYRIMRCAWVIE